MRIGTSPALEASGMAHRSRWQDLRIGIHTTLVVLVGALLILVFGRVGVLHGKKFTLFVTTDAARGVIRGTEVWLDGQQVGVVKSVSFRPAGVSPKERLVLALDLLENARAHVRYDSRVQIRGGTSVIGDQIVALSSGTAKARGVFDGDTIRAGEQTDFESMESDAVLASKQLPVIMGNVRLLVAQLHTAEGTLGAFGVDRGGAGKVGESAQNFDPEWAILGLEERGQKGCGAQVFVVIEGEGVGAGEIGVFGLQAAG
jgi:hypothetical protein